MAGRTALVIEDEEMIAWFFGIVLHDLQYEAAYADDGRSALDWLAEHVPALIIMDLNLPLISGVEVLRTVREDPRLAQVPVIIVSANPHMAGPIEDLADVVLQKPISYDQLRTLIERFK